MGFFDSSSSSSTTNKTDNIKKDVTIGNASQGFQSDNGANQVVSVLDAGAIAGAFDFLKMQSVVAGDNYGKLLNSTSGAFNSIIAAQDTTQSKGTLDNKTITMIALGVVAVLGIYFLKAKA